jgi:protease I
MSDALNDMTIAILATDGVEQAELTEPRAAIESAGGQAVLVTPGGDRIQAYRHDVEPADTFDADRDLGGIDPEEYDALVLPGGTTNPDRLRTMPEAVEFVRSFVFDRRPVAAICHGPWSLVEADVLDGKTLTSWPSLRTDIRNAGGTWQDEQVLTCTAGGWTLVTSRKPDDLPAFCSAMVDEFADGG